LFKKNSDCEKKGGGGRKKKKRKDKKDVGCDPGIPMETSPYVDREGLWTDGRTVEYAKDNIISYLKR
jgi:hypothetical protein